MSTSEDYIRQLIRERLHELEPSVEEYRRLEKADRLLTDGMGPIARARVKKLTETPQEAQEAPQTPPEPETPDEKPEPIDYTTAALDYLRNTPGPTTSMVANEFAISKFEANKLLRFLMEAGQVTRSGKTRGTRWHIVEDVGERGELKLNVLSQTHPTRKELEDREIVHTTEEPA
jgi:hypothetical protein